MPAPRRRRALLGAAAAVPVALAAHAAPPAAAAPSPPAPDVPDDDARFCSTTALTAPEIEAGLVSTIRCYDTYDESLRAVGIEPATDAVARSSAATSSDEVVTNATPLAQHFSGLGGSGEVLTISGNGCSGGGISFMNGDYWNDKISSTGPRGCSTIKHWSDANYTGTVGTIGKVLCGDLEPGLQRQVSSIRYY